MSSTESQTLPSQTLTPDRGARWTLPLAVALALTVLRQRVHTLFDGATTLRHFFDRAIGITTLQGVDASGYAHRYVELQILLAGVFLAAFAALHFLRRRLDVWADADAPEHLWIARLAEIWAALTLIDVWYRDDSLWAVPIFVGHAVLFAFALLVARTWVRNRRARRGDAPPPWGGDHHFVVATLLWPLPCLFAAWALFAAATGDSVLKIPSPGVPVATVFFLVYTPVWILLLWCAGRRRDTADDTADDTASETLRRRALIAFTPWLLVPLAMSLANELHATWRSVAPQTWALALIGVLGAASVATWLLISRRIPELPTRWLLHAVYFPIAVLSLAVLRFYRSIRHLGALDYFHFGEQTVPTHQLFEFGALPLIDVRPAHTLSDMFWQSLYLWFNGGFDPDMPLDMSVWAISGPYMVTAVLAYYLLARVFSPGYAVLAVSLLPIFALVPTYYAAVLIPALFLARALQHPTTRRFLALWLSLLFLALWRIDFGLLGAVSLAGVLALYLLRGRHRLVAAGKSLALATGAALLGLGTLLAFRGADALDRLIFLFGSYSYRLITRTRKDVIEQFDLVAVLQYHLLPWVALSFVLFYAVRRLVQRRYVSSHQAMLVFVATFSLIISVRSMERHSLIESFNPYLAVLLLTCLPVLVSPLGLPRERRATRAAFAGIVVAFSLAGVPPAKFSHSTPAGIPARLGATVFVYHRLAPDQPRTIFEETRHRQLVDYLESTLEDDQTFFDFTNSPVLYVLADRQFPTYVIPNLIQTSETVQADVLRQLDSLRQGGRLPVVVFKQGSTFWDNTDSVPNEIRSYRIAEWIYRHYRPSLQVGSYQVWRRSGLPEETPESHERVFELATRDDAVLRNLERSRPEESAETTTSETTPSERTPSERTPSERTDEEPRRLQAVGSDAHAFRLFDLSELPGFAGDATWHLELDMEWTGEQPVQLFFAYDGRHFLAQNHHWIEPPEEDGPIRVWIPEPAGARRLTDLRLDVPDGSTLTLRSARIRIGGGIEELTDEDIRQSFDLRRLPAVWARLDPLDAVGRTALLGSCLDAPVQLKAGEQVTLRMPELGETSSSKPAAGHYLQLRIIPRHPGRGFGEDLELRYADQSVDEPAAFYFSQAPPLDEAFPLRRTGEESLHDLRDFPEMLRWVYEATGPRPELTFPASGLPLDALPEEPHRRLLLRLHYRSRGVGRMAACLGCDSLADAFETSEAVAVTATSDDDPRATAFGRTSDDGDPAVLELPLGPQWTPADGERPPLRLALRFAPRRGTEPMFEIDRAELVSATSGRMDYLIRVSTQWRWASGDVDRLILRSPSRSVIVEGAWLRAGD